MNSFDFVQDVYKSKQKKKLVNRFTKFFEFFFQIAPFRGVKLANFSAFFNFHGENVFFVAYALLRKFFPLLRG